MNDITLVIMFQKIQIYRNVKDRNYVEIKHELLQYTLSEYHIFIKIY